MLEFILMRRIFASSMFLLPTVLLAQGTTSRVTGTVEDPASAAVPSSQVKLTNESTRVAFTTTATSSGAYVFDAIQPGTYEIRVEAPGFRTFISRGNAVTIGQPATINVHLELGAVSE